MKKKLEVKNYLLAFIETFSIWQMGIIFYSSKTLTINNLVNTPVMLDNSILIVLIGYVIGILLIYSIPNKTILFGRISTILSLVISILLFFPLPELAFKILYYLLTFNCVFFISINTSLIVNYYSIKSALMDGILASIVASTFIAIIQNSFIPFSFLSFNVVSIICLSLITFALFKLPISHQINLSKKRDKISIDTKKMYIGIVILLVISCLCQLFSNSIAESISNGVAINYLGGAFSGLLFLILFKKYKVIPFTLIRYYFGIISIGFILYLTGLNSLINVSLFLQGFSISIVFILPFMFTLKFETRPSKFIAPLVVFFALISVLISSAIIESFRNTPIVLYSIFCFTSILLIIVYLMIEQNIKNQYYNITNENDDINNISGLSTREIEIVNLMAKGYSVSKIASTLNLSEHTIKTHSKNIYKKYNIHSRFELISIIKTSK